MSDSIWPTTLLLVLFLALSRAAFAQSAFMLPQGYAPPALSGAGLSSAFGVSVTDVGEANPAALGRFDQTAVGVSYKLGTPAEPVQDLEVGPANGLRPQSVAAVTARGAWALGVSYNQRYAAEMDFGCIPRTTDESPEVEPADFCAAQTARLETLSPQAAYRKVFADGGALAVGVRLGVGFGSMRSQIDDVTGSFSEWGVQIAAGIRYRTDRYGLAAYYERALRVEGDMDSEGGLEPTDPQGGGPGYLPAYTEDRSASVSGAIPAGLSFSVAFDATSALGFGADLRYALWQAEDDHYENQLEVAGWARFDLSDRVLASLGVWRQGQHPMVRSVFVDDGRAVFLTLGGALTLDRFRLDAVVADNRLLSAEQHRQTLLKVGASVQL